MSLTHDERTVRDLAARVADAAAQPKQAEKARLFKQSNALKPERPMILLDPQNGWSELVPDNLLLCQDSFYRMVEFSLRKTLFRVDNIRDDMPILAEYPIPVNIRKTNPALEEHVRRSGETRGSYKIIPTVKTMQDVDALPFSTMSVDRKAHLGMREKLGNLFAGLLETPLRGISYYRSGLTRMAAHMYGLENLMNGMYDEPEVIHALMEFLCRDQIRELGFYQNECLFSSNNRPDYVTGSGGIAYCDDLPPDSGELISDPGRMSAWGESQEFTVVGPDQFGEFVLPYQVRVLSRFGLIDYGCCEPLDTKFDLIIKAFPKLRWVSVSPWANPQVAAEKLGTGYVYVYKPNPALICSEVADWEAARKQVTDTLRVLRGKAVHVVMKDTSTYYNQTGRPGIWVEMARQACEEAWA